MLYHLAVPIVNTIKQESGWEIAIRRRILPLLLLSILPCACVVSPHPGGTALVLSVVPMVLLGVLFV